MYVLSLLLMMVLVSDNDSSLHMDSELRSLLSDDNFEQSESDEDDEESSEVPDHEFHVKSTKSSKKVSLFIGSHVFRKRKVRKNGVVEFTCNGCEKNGKYVSARATVEDEEYQLVDHPPISSHSSDLLSQLLGQWEPTHSEESFCPHA